MGLRLRDHLGGRRFGVCRSCVDGWSNLWWSLRGGRRGEWGRESRITARPIVEQCLTKRNHAICKKIYNFTDMIQLVDRCSDFDFSDMVLVGMRIDGDRWIDEFESVNKEICFSRQKNAHQGDDHAVF